MVGKITDYAPYDIKELFTPCEAAFLWCGQHIPNRVLLPISGPGGLVWFPADKHSIPGSSGIFITPWEKQPADVKLVGDRFMDEIEKLLTLISGNRNNPNKKSGKKKAVSAMIPRDLLFHNVVDIFFPMQGEVAEGRTTTIQAWTKKESGQEEQIHTNEQIDHKEGFFTYYKLTRKEWIEIANKLNQKPLFLFPGMRGDSREKVADLDRQLEEAQAEIERLKAELKATKTQAMPFMDVNRRHHSPKLEAAVSCWLALFSDNSREIPSKAKTIDNWLDKNRNSVSDKEQIKRVVNPA